MEVENKVEDPKQKIEETAEIKQEKNPAAEVAASEPEQETMQQANWRKFREQREIERKEKEAAEKRAREKEEEAKALKEAMDALLNKSQPKTYQNDNHYDNQNDQELSQEEIIRREVKAAIAVKEQEYEKLRREQELREYPTKLQRDFSDFSQVCTAENLDYLEFHYPEVANAFKYAPDGYDKWANIYKAVKRFIPNSTNSKDAKKAQNNFNKPQSMAVPGAAPTGDNAPIYLDDKRRADNWARMQKTMKGI